MDLGPVLVRRDPSFGWDPWPNAATLEREPVDLLPARRFAGADTTRSSIGILPAGLDLYASYVDNFGGFPELAARLGNSGAFLLSITIFGNPAVCADIEPGAMHASDFPGWYDRRALKDNGLPWGYASASNMAAVIQAAAGRPFIRWSAHFGFGPHLCGPGTCGFPQAHWTQWADRGPNGENYDRSVGAQDPRPTPPPPPPPPPKPPVQEDDMITAVVKQDGRLEVFVEKADTGEVFHAYQAAKDGGWTGGEPKVRTAQWYSLGTPGK